MKAVRINKYGGREVLEVVEVPKPSAGKGQVLVQVYAASINPFDWKIREGQAKSYLPLSFPATMGGDLAGVVVGVGDEVFGQGGVYNGGTGSLAEFAAAKVDKIAPKPKNIDFIEAAALPLVGISALQAIEDHIKLQGGQKILVHGGAGGIGHIAIQIAKALGAYAATTVSGDDLDFVKSLGADEAIDYTSEDFSQKLADFDAVFDASGKGVDERSFKITRQGGVIVSMTGKPDEALAKKNGVSAIGQSTDSTPDRLARLTQLVEEGKIKVNVDKVFPLEQAKEAFGHLEGGHVRGKVVLKIKQ